MPEIRELPEGVWTRIAAGEVVERPCSAVKELVENALDAGAKRVSVRMWDGGRLRIVVEDDGCGMDFDGLPLALMPHATSKIRDMDDLEAIRTLGYRGEALSSLVAVASVEIRSRPAGKRSGGLIRASNGHTTEHIRANCPPGTRVQIDDLFGNFPARRKFLKSAAGELRRALAFIREYAVCRPDVAFILNHDGREVFSTDGSGERGRVLERIWGTPPEIRTVRSKAAHLELECWQQFRPGIKGANVRSDIMAFVNGRAVNDPAVKGAVGAAAREMAGGWALFFTLAPSLVDVNIHPAKAEVRFRYPGEVFEAVRDAAAQLGGPAVITVDVPSNSPSRFAERAASITRGWDFREGPKMKEGSGSGAAYLQRRDYPPQPANSGNYFSRVEPPRFGEGFDGGASSVAPAQQPAMEPEAAASGEPVYMGQTSGGYLVFDSREGLILMDPHAAHERVEYEKIRARVTQDGSQPSQPLLVPALLPPALSAEAMEYKEELKSAGFDIDVKDGGVFLSSVPSFSVERVEPEALLRSSLPALKEERGDGAREVMWRAWATMACKAAVKLTSKLSGDEALALWCALHECEQPFSCPHGRPTMLTLSNDSLMKHFGRE